METKNNSEFLSKIDTFINEMNELTTQSYKQRGLIIISSEQREDGKGSEQIGTFMGKEIEIINALLGAIRKTELRELLEKTLILDAVIGNEQPKSNKEG